MSLQLAAQHLAAQGRGPDKQLVHMSPREVAGLQALAMAHGGSLSVNPKTGLPEAGFLDNLLPTIIGAGLMYATGGAAAGALTPGMIGLGVGALQTARTGNLEKGLMAGLGAYGGAGLFAGLAGASAAGAGAAGAGAAQAAGAVPQAAATQGLGLADPAIGLAEQAEIARLGVPMPGAAEAAQAAGRQSITDFMAGQGVGLGPTGEIVSVTPPPTVTPQPAAPVTPPRGFLDGMSEVSAVEGPGVSGAGLPTRSTTLASRFDAMPTKDKFKYGLAALSPALLAQPEYKAPELDRTQYRYAYTPGRTANRPDDYQGEYTYFRPQYARLAAGGPVEAMSAANVYAMQNARGGVSDMGIDNSTGMQKMAEGGAAGLSGYEGYKGYSQPEQDQTKDIYERDDGNSGGMADRTDSSVAANPATTIAIGQALQGYGNLAFAPGAAIASMLGHGMVSSGINALGAMEAQAATNASNAAAASQANAGLDSAVDTSGEAMGMARGGISHLGDYSDGGRLLRGPGDGVSDSIPAMIGAKQPARLADGEFVVPARIVSELGNGSTDAGARKLYAMMDRIQKARGKTVGKGKVAKNSKAEKYLPA